MNLTKNKVLFLFVISAFLILINTSCTRKVQDSSTLTLTLPNGGFGSQKISEFTYSDPMSFQSVSTQEDDGAQWNPALNPSVIGDVNCFMVAVAGPESDMRRNFCTLTDGTNMRIGRWVGGIPAGGSISLEVPSGAAREITIIGFKAQNGACTNFKNSDVNDMNLSEPHIIGKVVKDLVPGTVSVAVPITVSGTTKKIDDCEGPDFNMERSKLYFGDATSADGTYTVTANKWYSTVGNSGAHIGGESRKIINFNTHPSDPAKAGWTFIEVGTALSNIGVDDEVMIINQGMNGPQIYSGGNLSITQCGHRAWEGSYGFARVMEVSTSPHGVYVSKGSFVDKLDWNPVSGSWDSAIHTQIVTNFSNTANSTTNFCRLKLVKVMHYWNFTVAASIYLQADPFDFDGDGAGIIPIRVANDLTLQNNAMISTTGKGYAPEDNKDGSGPRGFSGAACTGASNTTHGGACSANAYGSGGGGHGTVAPNTGGLSGGQGGGGTIAGGFGMGDNCGDGSCFGSLAHKMFMGAAGGSTASVGNASGKRAGGIVYMMAKNVVIPTGALGMITSAGDVGETSSYSTYGANGGHAGGSVFFGYGNLNIASGGVFSVSVNGGPGGTASSTGNGGGGGAGGRLHLLRCSSATLGFDAITQYIGGGQGGFSSGADDGFDGGPGSLYSEIQVCP